MKECGNCGHGRITGAIEGLAKDKKINPEKAPMRYCLVDRKYVQVVHSCKNYSDGKQNN